MNGWAIDGGSNRRECMRTFSLVDNSVVRIGNYLAMENMQPRLFSNGKYATELIGKKSRVNGISRFNRIINFKKHRENTVIFWDKVARGPQKIIDQIYVT